MNYNNCHTDSLYNIRKGCIKLHSYYTHTICDLEPVLHYYVYTEGDNKCVDLVCRLAIASMIHIQLQ